MHQSIKSSDKTFEMSENIETRQHIKKHSVKMSIDSVIRKAYQSRRKVGRQMLWKYIWQIKKTVIESHCWISDESSREN